jgi:hypothetical protein
MELGKVESPNTILRAIVLIAAFGLLAPLSQAGAQSPSPYAVETNIHGVYAYTQPPPGFNPSTASAEDLQLYGYPPRPAANASAEEVARWKQQVNPALIRVVPQLKATKIYHRPISGVTIRNSTNVYSSNWSGYALVQGYARLKSVTGSWMVPPAQQAFGTCSGTDYVGQWVGIDGFVSSNPRLFQSGSETDAACSSGTTTTEYYPWVEWLPASEYVLESGGVPLPFAPGDYVIVNVTATNWSGGKSSTGALIYTDVTQNWQISGTIPASSIGGTFVVGKSAEWVVEAPEVGASIATLANYITVPWFQASTQDGLGNFDYPGLPNDTTAYNVTMVDSIGNPTSHVKLTGAQRLWFFDEGSV